MEFFSKHIPIDDFRDCRKRVTAAWKSESKKKALATSKSMRIYNTEANFPILHQALKCRCEISEIKRIVEKEYKGGKIPCEPDEYGWQAIHYGARFYADNDKVIKYLLENSDDDVLMQIDGLGRYPLHIACDSKPNVKVIEMMMKKEKGTDCVLYKKTKYLEVSCRYYTSSESVECEQPLTFVLVPLFICFSHYRSTLLVMPERQKKSYRSCWMQMWRGEPSGRKLPLVDYLFI